MVPDPTDDDADRTTPTDDRIPVTVVSGYLGAGKTTLVNHLLRNPGDRRVAVVVNDMGEVNIDAELIASEAGEDGVVDLSNGCICCRLQGDLVESVERLAEERSFDYLLVEASGISEPVPIARAFVEGTAESDVDPTERFRLDTMVSVVDAYGFWKEFDAGASLPADHDPERSLADVIVEGIEFCDVLLLNKCDLVPEEALDEIEGFVRELGPRAELHRTTHSEVDPGDVLDTGRFDFERAMRDVGWKRHLRGEAEEARETAGEHDDGDQAHDHDHTHGHDHSAAERHGVSSVVYERAEPFHPERFADWLDDWSGDIIRAKGFFAVLGREDEVMGLSQAGPSVQAGPIGEWSEDEPETRLVFIGRGLDEETLSAALDDCLATDDERRAGAEAVADPFPIG
ncbi:CobW family GTP-binding protein [Halobium salinum]|uniref:CobW family GTP-binding protein n=1 Tax=Halobium salinum TaxID=1364940 RepID=A0ABD5PB13_9EURY|nr:GTP-binding protein [Halobium salinum]